MNPQLQDLNHEQYIAATSIDGYNYILAGAGSGKTATLVARVAYMISQGIEPEHLLLLTFTNKAAQEMKDRIIGAIGAEAGKITACTFHSFCAMFLRKNAQSIGYEQNFIILDSADSMDAISMAKQDFLDDAKKQGNEYKLKDFPPASVIAQIYQAAVNNCVEPETVIKMFDDVVLYHDEILNILQRYKEYKKNKNLMDYEDLLFYTEKILKTDELLREMTDKKYQYISCDEYQDTNTVQNSILNLISQTYPNLCVVGDDNQSIYAFRYANIQNILSFEEKHPGCKTVILDTNYRSSQEILDFANTMMAYATEGKKKDLKGTFHGNKPKLIVTSDAYEEADYIIEKIQQAQCPLNDIAVICRGAAQSYLLESKLNSAQIPYNKYGGIKFLEKPVIKDILAFLRLCVNPKDEIALFRLFQLYPGIGKTYAKKLAKIASEEGMQKAKEKYKKRAFAIYIDELHEVIQKLIGKPLEEQLKFVIKDYYKKTAEEHIANMNTTDGKKSELYAALKTSLEDAENLHMLASKYRSTARFLADLVLDAAPTNNDTEDRLNITTIHSAKGLEFHTVFVMDCIEGVTPRCEQYSSEDPEELRCMYVAVTRAKKELYLMLPTYFGQRNIRGVISHFLNQDDILATVETNVSRIALQQLREPCYFDF